MNIPLPSTFNIIPDKNNPFKAEVEISPLYPGYGQTIGNSLRRVLLSSLEGAGITSVKITRASHEFMGLPHIKEEVLEIILNLKQLYLKMYTAGPETLTLDISGKTDVKASCFKKNPNVLIANPDLHLADLTHKDAELKMEVMVEKGLGFSAVEDREKATEVGVIAIDTIFAPVRSVGYNVENVRVGNRTDYDKLILKIETNGTIEVSEAIRQSIEILTQQFNFILEQVPEVKMEETVLAEAADDKKDSPKKRTRKRKKTEG